MNLHSLLVFFTSFSLSLIFLFSFFFSFLLYFLFLTHILLYYLYLTFFPHSLTHNLRPPIQTAGLLENFLLNKPILRRTIFLFQPLTTNHKLDIRGPNAEQLYKWWQGNGKMLLHSPVISGDSTISWGK